MKKLTILSGAGISESGIQTFRDGDGLWENHNVTDVASPAGEKTELWYWSFTTREDVSFMKYNLMKPTN
jgi:NAD-dependent SIR2 family protein deacetylase